MRRRKILNWFFKVLFLSILLTFSAKVMALNSYELLLYNVNDSPRSGCNVVYYSQMDPAWVSAYVGSFPLGFTGCGVTSLAMIMSSYGALGSPLDWAQKLHTAGFFNVGDQRSFQPGAEKYAASLAGLAPIPLWSQDELENFLKTGHPVYAVCYFQEYSHSPSPHAVVLQGFDNGQTFAADPGANTVTRVWNVSDLWNIRRGKAKEEEDPDVHPSQLWTEPSFYGFAGGSLYTAVYRLYQPRAIFVGYTYPDPNDPGYCVDNYIGLHHYTTNVYEIEQMVDSGWDYEQVAFLDKGERWLYRVYNPNDGNHLFTLNSHEKNELTALGWHDEGVGWRVSLSGKPVYRIYNPGSGEHIYTLNYEEVKAAVAAGMHDEGIAWWS